jgi:predicted nucleic acid-binding protein
VYAVSAAPEDEAKKERALELIEHADFGLSAQVLQEFYVTVTRKIARPLSAEEAVALLEEFRVFPRIDTDYPLIIGGIEASLKHGISYWDGTIVAAAATLGASVLYTEDLSHGRSYGAVRAVNPFLSESSADRVHEPEVPQDGWGGSR